MGCNITFLGDTNICRFCAKYLTCKYSPSYKEDKENESECSK